MRTIPPNKNPLLRRAFSLVEVTMALGIATFAVVSVAGLLPVGLGALRESKLQMLEAQILKGVAAQNTVGSFTNLAFTAWCDNEGQMVESQAEAVFRVEVNETSTPPAFPGAANAFELSASLKAVRVVMTDLRTQTSKTNSLLVAKNGK